MAQTYTSPGASQIYGPYTVNSRSSSYSWGSRSGRLARELAPAIDQLPDTEKPLHFGTHDDAGEGAIVEQPQPASGQGPAAAIVIEHVARGVAFELPPLLADVGNVGIKPR